MKKPKFALQSSILPTLILSMLIFLGISATCNAQDELPIYTIISLMKVKQGNAGNYINLERTFWKPVHQELVKQGKILGWYLYRIQYTGTGDEYNYATVTHYRGSEHLDEGYSELFEKVHPNVPTSIIFEQTLQSRDLVSSRLLQWTLQSFPEEQKEPSRYAQVNYQKSIPGENYFALRQDHVKPAFDLGVKEGKIEGWGLWFLRFPFGNDMPYNWVSADFYNKFEQIGNYGWLDLLTRANPDAKMGASRTMVKSELWELIDYTR